MRHLNRIHTIVTNANFRLGRTIAADVRVYESVVLKLKRLMCLGLGESMPAYQAVIQTAQPMQPDFVSPAESRHCRSGGLGWHPSPPCSDR